jgi:biotin carboxyl carrier protein
MPGLIIEILVDVGDEVREYQTVIVLEAMKMENQIASTTSGKVIEINVKVGDAVHGEQVLLVLE